MGMSWCSRFAKDENVLHYVKKKKKTHINDVVHSYLFCDVSIVDETDPVHPAHLC